MTVDRPRCVIVADDLTGAADSSAALAAHGLRVRIVPWPQDGDVRRAVGAAAGRTDVDVLVVETASRELDADAAGRRLADVADALSGVLHAAATTQDAPPDATWVIKKIDSMLRGPLAAEVGALREGTGATTTVVAPAFPRLGRTTVDGVQLLDGVPVGTASTDHVPGRSASDAEVARACGLPAATLRAPGEGPIDGAVTVHDARTDADLAELAATLAERDPRPLIVCTAGLLEHLAPHLAGSRTARAPEAGEPVVDGLAGPVAGPVLVVSLSPTTAASAQLDDLVGAGGALRVDLAVDAALDDAAAAGTTLGSRVAAALADGGPTAVVLLGLEGEERIAAGTAPGAVRDAILRAVDAALTTAPRPPQVLANGGDSARALVDRWYSTPLAVVGPLPHGGALTCGEDGARLAMKSGGFGPATALTDIVDVLTARSAHVAGAHPS